MMAMAPDPSGEQTGSPVGLPAGRSAVTGPQVPRPLSSGVIAAHALLKCRPFSPLPESLELKPSKSQSGRLLSCGPPPFLSLAPVTLKARARLRALWVTCPWASALPPSPDPAWAQAPTCLRDETSVLLAPGPPTAAHVTESQVSVCVTAGLVCEVPESWDRWPRTVSAWPGQLLPSPHPGTGAGDTR